jgi:hypothetical protein
MAPRDYFIVDEDGDLRYGYGDEDEVVDINDLDNGDEDDRVFDFGSDEDNRAHEDQMDENLYQQYDNEDDLEGD